MIESEKGSVAYGLMQEMRKLEDRIKVLEDLVMGLMGAQQKNARKPGKELKERNNGRPS